MSGGRVPGSVDARALTRGLVAGLLLLVAISVVGTIIDRAVDDFDDSGWPVALFLAILVTYGVAGRIGGRLAARAPLTNGALAAMGAFACWVPIRVLIWAVRDDSTGLFSGDHPVFTAGGLFANLVFAAALGMAGAFLASRRAARA